MQPKKVYAIATGNDLLLESMRTLKSEVVHWVFDVLIDPKLHSERRRRKELGRVLRQHGYYMVTVDLIVHPWPNKLWRRGKSYERVLPRQTK